MSKTLWLAGWFVVILNGCESTSRATSSTESVTKDSPSEPAQACSCSTSYHYHMCSGAAASDATFSSKGQCTESLVKQAIEYCCPGYEVAKMNCDISDIADAVRTSEIAFDCK